MMNNQRNTCPILLYNPISGRGHLDGWLAMFAAILLQRGYTVYCLAPDTEALLLRLRQRGLEQHPNLAILPWPCKEHAYNFWHTLVVRYVNRLECTRITPDMSFLRRCKKRLAQLLVPPAYTFFGTVRRSVRALKATTDNEAGFLSPDDWGRQIQNVLRTLPSDQYFLFNMYMDMYSTDQASWQNFTRHCPLPWAGLRFIPEPKPREAYYTLPALRGMCFMDKALCQAYSATLPEKSFACLPDVTDASLPPAPPPAVQTITERAAGRKVVFMGGSIGGQKNIAQWRELIHRADPQRFFFVQVGEIHYNTCSQEEQNILHDLTSAPPENFFMHGEYLADERDFNACIAASDVIFAVYKNFRISSNMPGKAAAFGKPILVSDRYLMGETVRRYGLGAAVPEDDTIAILAALERLIQTPPELENFAAYNAAHNEEAMGRALEQFLDACMSGEQGRE